ncbi:MAG: hypothetical protein K5639_01865 [Eubacterium sp.]|nr:hypothetical protein [Eubacterium sp.]
MDLILLANIIVCALAFIGFVYGATQFFGAKKALYGQMITFAILCVVIGRVFNISRLITGGDIVSRFQLGTLATVGSFIFFFSSNYGALDSIVDDGSDEFKKYRRIAIVAPLVVLASYFPLFYMGDASYLWKVQGAVLALFAAWSSYYHLKHLIIPDVDFGVVKSLRPYNFLALCYVVSSMTEFFALSCNNAVLTLISCSCSAVVALSMIPLISYGLKKSRM